MFCNNCGNKIPDNSAFCPKCGSSVDRTDIEPQTGGTTVPAEVSQDIPMTPEELDRLKAQNSAAAVPPVMPQDPGRQGWYDPYQGQGGQQGQMGGQGYGYERRPDEREEGKAAAKGKNTGLIVALSLASVAVIAVCLTLVFFILTDRKAKTSDSSQSDGASIAAVDSEKEDEGDNEPSEESRSEEKDKDESSKKNDNKPSDNDKSEVEDMSFDSIRKRAAEKEPVNINYITSDVSDYPNVKVYFSVTDIYGNTVELDDPNIAIKEKIGSGEELERTVKSFEQLKGREGVSFSIAADKSDSMSGDIESMKDLMTQFVKALDYKTGDTAELIAFDSYVMNMCTYTNDQALLVNGISNMEASGTTLLYDALYQAVFNAGNRKGAKCVICFTDGMDVGSYRTAYEVIDLAQMYSVPVFIIGTSGGDDYVYRDITEQTGGQFWYIDSIYDLSAVLDQILAKEKDLYCLEYVSDGKKDAYSERSLSIVAEDRGHGADCHSTFVPVEIIEHDHDSRYEVVKADASWTEANDAAMRKGGHLATITSQEEMGKITKLCDDAGISYVWLGGYTDTRNGNIYGIWVTGENFNGYTRWYERPADDIYEPTGTDPYTGIRELYIMLWKIGGEWSWNDQANDPAEDYPQTFNGKSGYVIEYEY